MEEEIIKVVTLVDGGYLVNDEMTVPDDMGNRHRVMIQEWIDDGNTPDPYVEPELSYQDKRQLEYPPIGDQLDKIYHDGIDAWKADMIKPVKDKYAKE